MDLSILLPSRCFSCAMLFSNILSLITLLKVWVHTVHKCYSHYIRSEVNIKKPTEVFVANEKGINHQFFRCRKRNAQFEISVKEIYLGKIFSNAYFAAFSLPFLPISMAICSFVKIA